ncbi:amidase domain-containing protein [Heyndrickxia vini]|uniref:Amidase domain-containing protein n=1 Tax=Heyndrickxia vini TaxID=1476025 RepID=A0ABX7DYQ3_9BACI|nr:amidase domain-containing protein [Heyndrickxia vini]QQZ08432.1 amidase domain-containing protein [Heyndrickxia vini]
MKDQIKAYIESLVEAYVKKNEERGNEKVTKKIDSAAKRNAEIVKVKAITNITDKQQDDDHTYVKFDVHMQYLIKQKEKMYVEEQLEHHIASFYKNKLYDTREIEHEDVILTPEKMDADFSSVREDIRISYRYNRLKAVQYAERWWNSYNPAYKKFDVDCTNFISQCLHVGEAPMRGYPNKSQGWWLRGNSWSYSWSVANSLRLYLSTSKSGLQAREVSSPEELQLGDVICYDFQGDGRFDHNTIVTGKDAYGMPLVNAHTYNSRMRYWAYEDSSAYTPNIKYKFFTIIDNA